MVGILIVSDICLYREGLALVLRGANDIDVLGCASTVDEALAKAKSLNPGGILVDMAMREAHASIRRIAHAVPDTKLIAVTVCDKEILACAEAGIAGYVSRQGSVSDLVLAVKAATKGELHCTPQVAGSLLRRIANLAAERPAQRSPSLLTPQETRILAGIERGLSNKEIARQFSIEVPTVKNHVHNILDKLGVHRRGEAAALMRSLLNEASPTLGVPVDRALPGGLEAP